MEQNHTCSHSSALAPVSPPDGADPFRNPVDDAAPPPRRIRHDGWTPERQAVFLEALAACGVVADAARQAGMSAQGAYALRNRRAGRAFATAWDAVLIHRARGRLGDEVMSRALNGHTDTTRGENGETCERHRFDNRLSMAVLTRLDRLAEAAGDRAEHLRAVSEDMEELLDCLETGGDAEAFVDARRPAPTPEAAPPGEAPPPADGESAGLPDHHGLDFFFVWQDDDDEWRTNYPPPADFADEEEGTRGSIDYVRALTARERAVVASKEADDQAALIRDRDRFFGFEGGIAADEEAWAADHADWADGGDSDDPCSSWDWDHATRAARDSAAAAIAGRTDAPHPSSSSNSPAAPPIAPAADPPDMGGR
jgi:hypothetical protein